MFGIINWGWISKNIKWQVLAGIQWRRNERDMAGKLWTLWLCYFVIKIILEINSCEKVREIEMKKILHFAKNGNASKQKLKDKLTILNEG